MNFLLRLTIYQMFGDRSTVEGQLKELTPWANLDNFKGDMATDSSNFLTIL